MRRALAFLFGLAILPLAMQNACANEPAAYVVSYVEVAPSSHASAAVALKAFAAASRPQPGCLHLDVLQRVDRPHHFAVLEVWADERSRAAPAAATEYKKLRDALQSMQAAPYDERPHAALTAAPAGALPQIARGGLYAVTHVDFIPPKKDEGIAALTALAGPSRSDPGNRRFDVLQQTSRPNHLTIVEVWQDLATLEAHAVAAHTKRFRDQLLPMSGSLFDERLYRSLD